MYFFLMFSLDVDNVYFSIFSNTLSTLFYNFFKLFFVDFSYQFSAINVHYCSIFISYLSILLKNIFNIFSLISFANKYIFYCIFFASVIAILTLYY